MFTLSPAVLERLRDQAELSMQDTVTFFDVTIERNIYGEETVVSGVAYTYPCLIAGITGRDEEIVNGLRTEGMIKTQTAKCLVPWDATLASHALTDDGREWRVVWENSAATEEYKLYTKAIITRNTPLIEYEDNIRRNGG